MESILGDDTKGRGVVRRLWRQIPLETFELELRRPGATLCSQESRATEEHEERSTGRDLTLWLIWRNREDGGLCYREHE